MPINTSLCRHCGAQTILKTNIIFNINPIEHHQYFYKYCPTPNSQRQHVADATTNLDFVSEAMSTSHAAYVDVEY